MSTMAIEPAPAVVPQTANNSEGPRKRRKRAPVAGAANDCFTCTSRKTACDRRRPYCSTCLEAGQDCAGYKTQLTWGVGVASRGKLRGLSLPVAGTKKVAEATTPAKKKGTATSNNTASAARISDINASLPLSPVSASESSFKVHRPSLLTTLSSYQVVRPHPHRARHSVSGPLLNVAPPPEMLPSPASSHIEASPGNAGWPSVNGFQPPNMYNPSPISPTSYATTPTQDAQYFDTTTQPYHKTYGTLESYPSTDAAMNQSFPSDSPPTYRVQQQNFGHQDSYVPPSTALRDLAIDTHFSTFADQDVEEISRDEPPSSLDSFALSSSPLIFDMNIGWNPFSAVNSVGDTPRMQYLIQYYAEVIAPVIVAFDSPTNPFRDRILNLAAKSTSLQHALSALAASNLRQRKESGALSTGKTLPARRSSAAHLSLTSTDSYSTPVIPVRDQRREEVYHKYHAVQSLNAALADPDLLKDDAVLATLLVLCLFHICDSGIARFQTQFAGVKKLLTLRRNEIGTDESSTKWMIRLFTWFDAMAATVNERESQFRGSILDASAFSDEEWSYETLAGVDGRLFKIMSNLGRLNILSQGKPVESNPTIVSRPPPPISSIPPNNFDPNHFDGNGWMRIMEDENFFNMRTMRHGHSTGVDSDSSATPETRIDTQHHSTKSEQFWREWKEIRRQLQDWNLNTFLYENTGFANIARLTKDQCLDIDNVSNAFRYSALLYTERLGHPTIASSHEKIQYWVQRALHHIKHVRSDVYLLWPLFITGSECVHEEGRNIIRERCEDIQKDSGFVNNASCLALLEKVWKVVPVVRSENPNNGGQTWQQSNTSASDIAGSIQDELRTDDGNVNGFRFRDVMQAEGNDGEWIVV